MRSRLEVDISEIILAFPSDLQNDSHYPKPKFLPDNVPNKKEIKRDEEGIYLHISCFGSFLRSAGSYPLLSCWSALGI